MVRKRNRKIKLKDEKSERQKHVEKGISDLMARMELLTNRINRMNWKEISFDIDELKETLNFDDFFYDIFLVGVAKGLNKDIEFSGRRVKFVDYDKRLKDPDLNYKYKNY